MLTVCAQGKFRIIKNRRGHLCDMLAGFDAEQHQLIHCKNIAKYLWFERKNVFDQGIKISTDVPLYATLGARICAECFGKLVNPQGESK